jgi:hypothetical protein
LYQNYPNPFNPKTIINYELRMKNYVTLKVFDILGREVATLVQEFTPPGSHRVEFDGNGLVSGMYFYRLTAAALGQAENAVLVKRMILLR